FEGDMAADRPYRVVLVGDSDGRLREVQQQLVGHSDIAVEFEESEGGRSGSGGLNAAASDWAPDVLVIGPHLPRPIEAAGRLRNRRSQVQIVFLGQVERLNRLRTSLPYVPQLSDAWTAEAEAPPATVRDVILQAAREARRRAATAMAHDRINARLSSIAAPSEARRRFRQMLLSEKYLAIITKQAPIPIFAVNLDGRVISWNDAASDLFLCEADDAIGRYAAALFAPSARQEIDLLFSRAVQGEALVRHEAPILLATGKVISAEISVAPLRGENDNDLISLVVMVQDITDRKQAERVLEATRRELTRVSRVITVGQMAASIAHDVNQPLAAIAANGNAGLRWLGRADPDLQEARLCLGRILENAGRAADVVAGVRALFARERREIKALSVNDLVREVLAVLKGDIAGQSVRLQCELSDDLPDIMGDRIQLQQVLMNLISNAIDALTSVMDRERMLIVKTWVNDAAIMIAVEDSGAGIRPEDADHIFEEFFTTKPQGMGMGLSICRSIIVAHDGRLWSSPRDPHGTRFLIELPGVH
ncbi:MAG: PAS domain S-box protein, partial [Alphaproteobacteria bacterium]|nr:PAS domain S-box protein [Alphaproteobacteria bacterium]